MNQSIKYLFWGVMFSSLFISCENPEPRYFSIDLVAPEMLPFSADAKTTKSSLLATAQQQDTPNQREVSINAQLMVDWTNPPYLGQKETNFGVAYLNGKLLRENTTPLRNSYYIATNGDGKFFFGKGEPDPKQFKNAVSGGLPLIIDGVTFKPYFMQEPKQQGKTIVAYNPKTNIIRIIVQRNYYTKAYDNLDVGMAMSEIRNKLLKEGFTNALSFDGNDSVMLVLDKQVVVAPNPLKDDWLKMTKEQKNVFCCISVFLQIIC